MPFFALQKQALAGVNQMGVLDVVEVHAPQLGPAPWAFEKHFRNVPQVSPAFDGVTVGGVGGQFAQGNAFVGDLIGSIPLGIGDGVILCQQPRCWLLHLPWQPVPLLPGWILPWGVSSYRVLFRRNSLISYARFCAQVLDSATYLAVSAVLVAEKWRK
jgi:hypothetical protein